MKTPYPRLGEDIPPLILPNMLSRELYEDLRRNFDLVAADEKWNVWERRVAWLSALMDWQKAIWIYRMEADMRKLK